MPSPPVAVPFGLCVVVWDSSSAIILCVSSHFRRQRHTSTLEVFRAYGGPDLGSTWFSLILGSPGSWKSLRLFSFREVEAGNA